MANIVKVDPKSYGSCDCNEICDSSSCVITPHPTLSVNWSDPVIEEVTEIIVAGDGQFDDYMNAGLNQLERQYDEGRIKGADLATAHIQMYEIALTQANEFVLKKYEIDARLALLELEFEDKKRKNKLEADLIATQVMKAKSECETSKAQKGKLINETHLVCTQKEELILNGISKRNLETQQALVAAQQIELYKAQSKGYEDSNRNDTYKTTMNAWAVYVAEIDNGPLASPSALLGSNVTTVIDNATGAASI